MKKIMFAFLFLVGCGKSVEIDIPTPKLSIPYNVKLNGPLVSGGNVSDKFKATNDGKKIVYISDEATDTVDDLYVVNLDGSNRLNLTNLVLGKKVTLFALSPNSQKIAFLSDINTTGRFDLYTINLDGTNLQRINIGLADNTQRVENNFRFSNSGGKVIYVTDEESTGVRNIYSANTDGTGRLRLNQVLGTQVTYALASDDSRVVYRTFSVNPVARSVTLSATGDVLLNTPFNLVLNPAAGVQDFKISPDATKVIYRANQDDGAIFEIYVVNLDGTGVRTKVNGSIVLGGIVSSSYDFSANSSKIVYIADQQTDEVHELYSVNLDGGSNVKISATPVSGGDVASFKITPDSQKVVYLADQSTDGVNELFSVNMTGLSNTKINSNLIAGEQIINQYDLLGNQVIYSSDKNQSGFYSVYTNQLNGSNEVKLSSNISSGVGFFDSSNLNSNQFESLMDVSRIILLGSDVGVPKNISSVKLDGSSNKVLNEQVGGSGVSLSVTQLGSTFLAVGEYVVYRYNNGISTELYVALAKD